MMASEWRDWIAENVMRGATPHAIVEALVTNGVPQLLAQDEVSRTLAESAARRRIARMTIAGELRRSLRARRRDAKTVERRAGLSADEFYQRYYYGNEPVVMTDLLQDWPALHTWTPSHFKERFGTAAVEFDAGRNGDPNYDQTIHERCTQGTMTEFIERIETPGIGNDVYMIANNRTIERKDFEPLLRDVTPRADIFALPLTGKDTRLWIGPAGTHTTLHHDGYNNVFCQIYGTKRVWLAAPDEPDMLDNAVDYFCAGSLAEPRFDRHPWLRRVQIREVALQPGDALLIPVGWWHEVKALTASINFCLLGFHDENRYDWYLPGRVQALAPDGASDKDRRHTT